MLQKIRNSRWTKGVSLLLAFQLFLSGLDWNPAYAGDGGPTQPEVHSFEPIGTDQMVDLFTGDFTYNIPLFNLPGPDGGYPINLAYHSGVQMDQEASWVGLGWNINMGTINRQIRNLPDDFGGADEKNITIKTDMKPNWTVGARKSFRRELWGFDNIGGQTSNIAGALNTNVTVFYNNYKGIGYSIDTKFDLSFTNTKSDRTNKLYGDLGFGAKFKSTDGISPSVTLGVRTKNDAALSSNTSISTDFNTRTGWQRDVNISSRITNNHKELKRWHYADGSGGSTISFARSYAHMQIPQAMRGASGSFEYAKGLNFFGLLQKSPSSFSFDISFLQKTGKSIDYNGIGYMYYQQTSDSQAAENDYRVKDVSRENDGLIHKDTRRLGTPSLSYDIYSVTGQGIGNMFRPVRTDIGTVVSPFVESKFFGGNLAFEKSTVGNPRYGMDIGFSYSGQKTALWPNSNAAGYTFQDKDASLSRSVYFKNYGELSQDDITANYGASIASNKPVVYGLNAEDNFYNITNIDQNTNGANIQINTQRSARRKRAVGVEAFTNGMIMNGSSSLIPEFDISYYQNGVQNYDKSYLTDYDAIRANLAKTHVGGYMATNEGGMRYVYALPAINKLERDVTFSVKETPEMLSNSQMNAIPQTGGGVDYKQSGTDKYYNSVQKNAYAHSYLLTSILGQDYVDNDAISGPSDGDLGYWVRFNYRKAYDNYKWRSPYKAALYDKGYETSFTDGKGRYSYGEKEIWYVATVETKTHIAEFIVSPRQDCKQVNNELDGNTGTGSYYKLDRIDIYTKSERYKNGTYNASAKPVQSCHFTYNYSLCKKTPDNNGTDGKLTLEKVHFTYRNNLSGAARPYDFEYNTQVNGTDVEYARDAVDRWGNYQPGGAANIDYPYNDPLTSKAEMDQRAALWNLKAINLPSGGRYEVDYESDSYAYVQNEVAMHMFKIASLEPYRDINDQLIAPTTAIQHGKDAADQHRKVFFQLEKPIPSNLSAAERKKLMLRYIREGEYLYFKVKINLTKNNNTKEYVGGYAKVLDVNVDDKSSVNGNYIWGYVTLDYMRVNGESTQFHPFTEAGARHIRYNQSSVLYEDAPNADMEQLSKSQIKNIGATLLANGKDFIDIFKDFTAMLYDDGNDRLSDIDLGKSYLRMRTPDKIKYGGGHRVREIRVIDNWAASFLSNGEASSTYGTVYDYNMTDANGETISSGVAAYEPMVGGDEIPLRNPVEGWEDKNIASKTMAQTYTEEPGNESLFPGPTVGYRQVKVMSLNTAQKKNLNSSVVHYSGITVHEFYTAKDYPVITDVSELEQNKTFRKSRLIVPALIVNVDRLRMAATQGYYIETNDMHGKPKGAREIAFNAQGVEEEVSSVQYDYFDEAKLTTNRAGETFVTRSLKNEVDVLYKDVDPSDNTQSDIRPSTLGTEVEFVPETRYHQSRSISAGLQLNFELNPFALFFPVPSFNWQEEKTGTVVTNKIVNKAGIVKKVTAKQRGSVAETENLVFDDLTGMPLLTSLTNDYGDKIYNYSILAKDQYESAGGMYQNIGKSAVGTAGTIANGLQEVTLVTPSEATNFVPGDVLLAIPVTLQLGNYVTNENGTKRICYYNKVNFTTGKITVETANTLSGDYRFTIIRSGRRNNLTAPISSITALSDPTKNRVPVPCLDRAEVKNPQSYNLYTIDNVLSINAVELGHHWYKDTRQLGTVPGTWYDNAVFSKGFGGVLAPVRSYAYVDNRKQNTTSGATDVRLKTDGVMDDVTLFNWDRIQASPSETGCITKWREVDQITLKNPSGFDIETRNILKTYSSSLYGRSGTEPIAVAGNARNTEIGVENFEEYAAGTLDITQNASNNLNFYTAIAQPNTPRYVEDRFDVVGGANRKGKLYLPSGAFTSYQSQNLSYAIRIHFDAYQDPNTSAYYKAEEVLVRIPSTSIGIWLNGYYTINLPTEGSTSPIQVPKYEDRKWRGELFARRVLPNYPATANSGVSIVEGVAHTGNKSLAVAGNVPAKFIQGRLKLQPSKEYQFSGWLSTPNNRFLLTNENVFFNTPFQIEFFDASGNLLSNETITYSYTEILQGTFIDDWQKFTLNFQMPSTATYASITLACTREVYSDQIGDYTQVTYYDDLRLQPRDGAMQTYVYNQENQRLEAMLDDNNYATFYYYDDEGNLFLVKRETEKGIITVQESRTYLQKN